jgi:membrane protein insertase Oxa1/YidC/SpoIIIJ
MSATGQKSFGLSIVLFTLLLKVLTYPLTYTQLQSTTKMQAIQPKVRTVAVGRVAFIMYVAEARMHDCPS